MKYGLIYLCCIVMASCAASSENDYTPHTSWPDRSALYESFRAQDTAIIVYAKEDYALGDMLVNGLAALQQNSDRFTMIMRRDDEITDYEVKNFPLYIIGTREHLLIRRLSGNIPVTFIDNGFTFNEKTYNAPNDIIKISFFPNVYNPQMPITVIYGNHEEVVVQYVQQEIGADWGYFFWDNWGYQVYHNGKRSVLGNFSQDAQTRWSIDKKQHWEFDYAGDEALQSGKITYVTHNNAPAESITAYDKSLQADLSRVEAFCKRKISENFTVHIYPGSEIKTLMWDNPDQSTIDYADNSVHTVIGGEFTGKPDEKVNMLALRLLLGMPSVMALEEGLAVHLTNNWQGVDVDILASKLLEADALPAVSLLTNNDAFEGESDYLMHIAAASFVDFLINENGESGFIGQYTKATSNDFAGMDTRWHTYVRNKAATILYKQRSKTVLPEMLQGFNFAHEGYQIYNGYMGSEADRSVAKLKELGCNTLSIIPYSVFQSMTKPTRFRYTSGAGAENDVAVIHAGYTAKQQGMYTMLKPQLWSWLGWTGDIKMQNEQDWDAFFEYYEEWIMHYALLAEIYQFDILCVGNEFQAASLSKHAKWDELFAKVRKVYSGHITYAANWGAEFEQVDFWDQLDFISVNCYYPLTDKTDPSDLELMQGFESNLNTIEAVSKKYNMPVVFTEIGFKSIAQPWLNPHKDADEFDYDETAQARCYKVMADAMQDEQWITGVYLWKWPSYMGFAKEYEKDFNPCGKEAEAVIGKWFAGK